MKKLNISARAFWDTDFSKIDFDKFYRDVIRRVFDRGTDEELQAVIEYYGYDKIKEVLTTEEFLTYSSFPRAIAYLGIKREEFRYHTSKKWPPIWEQIYDAGYDDMNDLTTKNGLTIYNKTDKPLEEVFNIKSKNMKPKKQSKPYPIESELLISQSEGFKAGQLEMVKNYKKTYHYCEYTTMTQNWGDAIKHCYEDNDGCFWAGHDEYESQVNYCPFCGTKARVQAIELQVIPDKEKKRLYKIDHALEVVKKWTETGIRDAKEKYQKDIDHLNNLLK